MKVNRTKNLGAGQKMYFGTFAFSCTSNSQRRDAFTSAKLHLMYLTLTIHTQAQPIRQRIDHRNTDTVQTTRNLITVLVEFTTGVQFSHNDFGCTTTKFIFFMNVGWNATTVVRDRNRIIRVNRDDNIITVTR